MVSCGKRIALGMSGGVDSSVAAIMLREDGWDVVGVTCLFVSDDADRLVADARMACESLGIEHVVRDCTAAFEERIVAPFVQAYVDGLTPSPCVECNARAKIPFLMEAAYELGCSHVATGHYARMVRCVDEGGCEEAGDRLAIGVAADAAKDQSYMLAMLSQDQLARLVLPLGEVTKAEVRRIAEENGLSRLARKSESQDICFAAQGYRQLLELRGIEGVPGAIVLDGTEVGRHTGLIDYTVGQRKGIGVAGPEPYYVLAKDASRNELRIGTADQARVSRVEVTGVNWQAVSRLREPFGAQVKLRYRSTACPCIIRSDCISHVSVSLSEPQPSTSPGQYAVFYRGSTVLGGGVIEEVC